MPRAICILRSSFLIMDFGMEPTGHLSYGDCLTRIYFSAFTVFKEKQTFTGYRWRKNMASFRELSNAHYIFLTVFAGSFPSETLSKGEHDRENIFCFFYKTWIHYWNVTVLILIFLGLNEWKKKSLRDRKTFGIQRSRFCTMEFLIILLF